MGLVVTPSNNLVWNGGAGCLGSNFPVTMFGWGKVSSLPSDMYLFGSNSGGYYYLTYIATNGLVKDTLGYPGNGNGVNSGASYGSNGVWIPFMSVAAATYMKLYFGSTPSGYNLVTSQPNNWANHSDFKVGHLSWSGEVAECHIWNAALGDTEWASLKGGALPETIGSGYLDGWTLQTLGNYTSIGGSRVLTPTGTITQGTHPITRNPPASLTGSITLDDIVASGSMSVIPSSLTGSITLDDLVASGSLGLVPGTITTAPYKNWGGQVQAGVTIPKVVALRISDLAVVASLTNQVTNGAGVLAFSNAGLVPGVAYLVVSCNSDGSAFGCESYVAA